MQRGWTALMEASEEGHAEIVHMLLEAGATPSIIRKVRAKLPVNIGGI